MPASRARVEPAVRVPAVSPPLGGGRPVAVVPPAAVAAVAVRALAGVRRVPGVRAVSAGVRDAPAFPGALRVRALHVRALRVRAVARGRLVHESEAAVRGRRRARAVEIGKRFGARRAERWTLTLPPPPRRAASPRGGIALGVRDERAPSHRRVLVVLPRVCRARRAPRVRAGGHERDVGVLAVVLQALAREVDGLRRGDAAERYHAAHAVVAGPARRDGTGTGTIGGGVGSDRKAGTRASVLGHAEV